MGKISEFERMRIYMNTEPNAPHHSPHCHVYLGENRAVINTATGEVLAKSRNFPLFELRLAQMWVRLRKDALAEDWELAFAGKLPKWIDPLEIK